MIDQERVAVLHEAAMQLAERGLLERDSFRARDWFRSALEKERAAAGLLMEARDEEPTRSVLFRSAATLALDCNDYVEAERLIEQGLAGAPPAEIAGELKDLRRRVRSKRRAAGEARSAEPGRKLRTA